VNPSSVPKIEVEISVEPPSLLSTHPTIIEPDAITAAVVAAADRLGFTHGTIGVRITDDRAIRTINAKHLGHDWATDVISFAYKADGDFVNGELVASIDTAIEKASQVGWSAVHELLLYVVHGTLHIGGMDDHDDADRAAMRSAEADVMMTLGISEILRFGVSP
jgi:probable rRNA maturation factor